MTWPSRRSLPWLLLLPLGASPGWSQEPVDLPWVTGIQMDGRLDDSAWSAAVRLPFLQFAPVAGAPPSDTTGVLVGHDATYLYVAGRFEAAGGGIQATSLTRDRIGADDVFRLTLDTFDDNVNAVQFAVTPAGVQADYAISQGGESISDSWNTFWDVATAREDGAWYVEMRIPLSSLRFEAVDGVVRMGLIASRYVARTNELSAFPRLDPRLANAERRPSAGATVTLRGVRQRTPVYLTPYVLGGRAWGPPPSAAESSATGRNTAEVGLDVKAALSSNLTLDLTANTDFAQVESDDEQINLTRFSLFFPEKRQFFLERAGIFQVATGGLLDNGLLFHSRRIGLDSEGRPLRIYGGARVVGRFGGWDLGVLDMQTAAAGGSGSENLGVVSIRRRLLDEESTAGVLLTTRVGQGGRRQFTWGTDGRLRWRADDYVIAQVAGTDDSDGASGTMVRVALERPSTLSSQGFGYTTGLKWSGASFRPALGFQPREDFTHTWANIRYGFFPGAGSAIRVIQPSVAFASFWRNRGGGLESLFGAFFLNYELNSGVNGWAGGAVYTEVLQAPLALGGDAVVPAGRYHWPQVEVGVFPSAGQRLQAGVLVGGGGFYDGNVVAVSGVVTWSASEHLTLETAYDRQHLRFEGRNQTLDPDLLRLRVQYALDTRLSVSSLIQYNRLARQTAGNVRVRFRFAEGRDLYLVWNERLNLDLDRDGPGTPLLPRSQGRTLQVKYSHTLIR